VNGQFTDYYAEFGIPENATAEEIGKLLDGQQRTWGARASRAPSADKRREAEDKVALIAEARAELLDRARRAAYDQRRARARDQPSTMPPPQTPPRTPPPPPPQAPRDWLAKAIEEVEKGNTDAALYQARQAVHHDERNPLAWRLLGALNLDAGRTGDALHELRQALELAPDDPLTHTLIGSVHARQGNHRVASDWRLKAWKLEPTTERHVEAADALYAAARYDEALGHYEQCLAEQPSLVGVRNQIARIWALRAEGAKVWDPQARQYVVASADAAQRILPIVDQALAVQPTDQALCEGLANTRAQAVHATGKMWKPRRSMVFVVLACFVVNEAIDNPLVSWLAFLGAIAVPVWMGWKPRWWHTRRKLPATALNSPKGSPR
jgi:tetratricopeptide (TPR) repeat protein